MLPVINCAATVRKGDWSSGMIPALGAGGREFDSRITPLFPFVFVVGEKKDPRNRSRTSDLEISVVTIYSLPLCQLSYTRIAFTVKSSLQSVGIEPTLLRTRALSVRLNRSAKTASLTKLVVSIGPVTNDFMAQWQRVGFQTRRLGVRFPLRSFYFFVLHSVEEK
jgi:hypothetical protein